MTNIDTSIRDDEYLFDTGSDLGATHMDGLAQMLDGDTFGLLEPITPGPGKRCLDVGAGGGSVTRWLAGRVGPTGEVVAVDIDTRRLTARGPITVHRHDVNAGLAGPLSGPYDLIHARNTLVHLPRRDAVFAELADALAPGGWIVVGDPSGRPLRVLSRQDPADVTVWERIQHLSHEVVGPAAGMDIDWAHRINDAMTGAGLERIHGIETSRTVTGGSPGALMHAVLNAQAHDHLVAAGAEEWELARYQELTRDTTFRTWFYQFVCFAGRRPTE